MLPAAEIMKECLSDIEIAKPTTPVVMNSQAKPEVDPERIRNLLVDQIVHRVRWRETINYISANEITTFFEVGVGRVLSGLVKRIAPSARTTNISSIEDILKTMETLKNENDYE